MSANMESNYSEALWEMFDQETTGPTLHEAVNPERGGPEEYFGESIREGIAHARKALAELETALDQPGWFEPEADALDSLQEAVAGIGAAVTGRVILGRAIIADANALASPRGVPH